MNFRPWAKAIESYKDWLETLPTKNLARQWSNRINSSNDAEAEGAVAEAVVRDYLVSRDIQVDLAETLKAGGVDFLCRADATMFYIEVANIGIRAATRATGLDHIPGQDAQAYGPLTTSIYDRIQSKTAQLEKLDSPLLVCVTTLHFTASAICIDRLHVQSLLTGTPFLSGPYDTNSGTVGAVKNTVDFRDSPFVSSLLDDNGHPITTRRYLSAIVAGGFGLQAPDAHVFGVLHPDPKHSFDPNCLPDVPFASIAWPPGSTVRVRWNDQLDVTPNPRRPRIVIPSDIGYDDLR